ncbi:MAG: CPBP family intramembrane metalloprotease [Candidatus Marinimicrobia bacterium]|nr:CPBP family intramembrane metalloprotease [Candidatus Neomarinimicrobiota bacterium]MCF7829435.1 CPBP family intramembrane metalloprotease [Candidatus Neomarinimicrobiota bacterium]MCF7880921.1 CPBP family intramembrane metalloprotease [Candidatus Neomarinimicrobiota bacterium]
MIQEYTYKPVQYFFLTFLVSFAFYFAGAYLSFHETLSDYYMLFMLIGLMTPFLLSAGMIFTAGNANLIQDFANRLVNIKLIDPKTLPFFILLMPLSVIASILLSLPFGESLDQIQLAEGFSFSTGFVPVLLLLFLAATFEELGWRGYAFDSLQSRYSILTATLIFSVLWSLWHFPLLFVKDSYQYEILHQNTWFAVNFFVSIIPLGIIITWICIRNRKSVIAAALFHFIVNLSQEVLAITQITKSVETLVLSVVAVAIIIIDKEVFFPRDLITEEATASAKAIQPGWQ